MLNGWQKTRSIEDSFILIFPDLFRDSYLQKTEQTLKIGYTAPENPDVEFQVTYWMQQTLAEAEEKVLQAGGKLQQEAAENRIAYDFVQDAKLHQGFLYETQFSEELLGSAFGEEEPIIGVMWVELVYPESMAEEYQQEQYRFYVINNREEE